MKKVYIAGSGSGDIGNLTLKVKNIIETADVIFYDNLVSDEIISLSKRDAILYDVGKISGNHRVKQEDTNKLLVEYAQKYDKVLRLKGGDPFVFGRGAEEAQELFDAGIDFEIMPAVTSVTSVPASIGIPVTHRDYASSFFVITARKKKDVGLDEQDFRELANLSNTTLIFMMSTSSAKIIAQGLIKAGKDADTNVMIISNGTKYNSKKYSYTLETLSKIENNVKFEMPGMIVVGDVVLLSKQLDKSNAKTLSKKRIIINVAREKENRLEKKLYELGADVLNVSTNTLIKKYEKSEFLDIMNNVKKYKYICFTSVYAVDVFFDILKENNIDIRNFNSIKIACVGIATYDRLKNKNIIADIVPKDYNAKSLAKKLIEQNADNILLISPHSIESDLFDDLKSYNKNVKRLDLYEQKIGKVRIYTQSVDDIYAFTSASSVLGLVNSYDENHFVGKTAFCIGEKTQQVAEKYGFNTIKSEKATVDSLVDCIVKNK